MTTVVLEIVMLLCAQLLFAGVFFLALVPMSVFKRAGLAVLKRNFLAYFSNPTGYVFLCLFVLLSSFAAFWPHDFFNSNMATLSQLNSYLPYIMLIFVPAITMSIWAEERREGTDEVLLTIPASDFDIVLGKYLAAAATFSVSLLFSQLCNYAVLSSLAEGNVDFGLFLTTYLGYWLVGLAMISIGMVASFLTKNLTVGFVLGIMLNAPLVFAANAEYIVPGTNVAQTISRWSIGAQFEDFGRGVISLSSLVYFGSIIVLGIYLSVVMIGKRHWRGGRDGRAMLGHYVVRTISLAVIAVAATFFFNHHDLVRLDLSSNRVSSMSNDTKRILDDLRLDRTVYVEAYISKTLPEAYVKTKYDVVTMLREIEAKAGDNIKIIVHSDMEPFSEEAQRAEDRYGIRPRTVRTISHGAISDERIFLSAVVSCALERVVIPFFGQGSSVEYELIRAISTASAASQRIDSKDAGTNSVLIPRRVIGVVTTDAQIMGTLPDDDTRRTNMGGEVAKLLLINDLQRQYTVKVVDPGEKIETGFLFSLEKSVDQQLNEKSLSREVRAAFKKYEHELPKSAQVQVVWKGRRWQISFEEKLDGGEVEQRNYEVKRIGNRLNVYDSVNYDVLLVVQPSTMSNLELSNLIQAMREGQPMAIFEDPAPVTFRPTNRRDPRGQPISVYAALRPTDFPRSQRVEIVEEVARNPQLAEFYPPPEKGETQRLWDALGIRLARAKLAVPPLPTGNPSVFWQPVTVCVWQAYNPYPKIRRFGQSIVFANPNSILGDEETTVFNPNEPAVSDLDEVAFLFPGSIEDKRPELEITNLKFSPLVTIHGHTGVANGWANYVSLPPTLWMKDVQYKVLVDVDIRDRTIYINDLDNLKLPVALKQAIQKDDPNWTRSLPDEEVVVTRVRAGEKWQCNVQPKGNAELANRRTYILQRAGDRLKIYSEGDWPESSPPGREVVALRNDNRRRTGESYTLAARVSNKRDEGSGKKGVSSAASDVDVIVVCDADVLGDYMWTLREQPTELGYKFQNSAFVLNILDDLAGDDRFLDVRQRQINHATLRMIEKRVKKARDEVALRMETTDQQLRSKQERADRRRQENREVIIELNRRLDELQATSQGTTGRKLIDQLIAILQDTARVMPAEVGASVQGEIQEKLDELQELQSRTDVNAEDVNNLVNDLNQEISDRIKELEKKHEKESAAELEQIDRETNEKNVQEERQLNLDKLKMQNQIKLWAVVLPPIPPLVIGLLVFGMRRWREREGISKARRR